MKSMKWKYLFPEKFRGKRSVFLSGVGDLVRGSRVFYAAVEPPV